MNQRKTVCYEEGQMPFWLMEQLAMGIMDVFFPVSFMKEEQHLTAAFQIDGYRPLSQIHTMSTEDVFQILYQVMMQMETNEKHYLFPESYEITRDTVYFDPLKNRVKMIYRPSEEGLTGKERLSQLILDCKTMVSEEGRSYLDSLAEALQQGDHSYRSAIHRCELLQQEIYVCDIP